MNAQLAKIRKALVAGVGAGAGAYATAISDGSMSQTDWIIVVGTVLVVGYATWRVPNKAA